MKILLFTENYHAGGMDTWIINLINYWPAEDNFYLVCNYDHPGLEFIEKKLKRNCAIIRHNRLTLAKLAAIFSRNKFINILRAFFMLFGQYGMLFYHYIYFQRILSKIAPDKLLIINGGYPGGSTCRAAALTGLLHDESRKPIMIYHNEASRPKPVLSIFEYFLDRLIVMGISQFITVSKSTQASLNLRPGFKKIKKSKIIYNGVERPRKVFQESLNIKEELNIPDQARVLLMLGTYELRKGHDLLLKSLALTIEKMNQQIHLIVAGYGYPEDRERVSKLVCKYKLDSFVHLLDFRYDVPELLCQCDILVVPSQSKESFGLMIAEAMSYAVPVIATSIGGIPEVLQNNEAGFLIENNAQDLSDKILFLLNNDIKRKEMGAKGYKEFESRFTADRMAKEYYAAINQ